MPSAPDAIPEDSASCESAKELLTETNSTTKVLAANPHNAVTDTPDAPPLPLELIDDVSHTIATSLQLSLSMNDEIEGEADAFAKNTELTNTCCEQEGSAKAEQLPEIEASSCTSRSQQNVNDQIDVVVSSAYSDNTG